MAHRSTPKRRLWLSMTVFFVLYQLVPSVSCFSRLPATTTKTFALPIGNRKNLVDDIARRRSDRIREASIPPMLLELRAGSSDTDEEYPDIIDIETEDSDDERSDIGDETDTNATSGDDPASTDSSGENGDIEEDANVPTGNMGKLEKYDDDDDRKSQEAARKQTALLNAVLGGIALVTAATTGAPASKLSNGICGGLLMNAARKIYKNEDASKGYKTAGAVAGFLTVVLSRQYYRTRVYVPTGVSATLAIIAAFYNFVDMLVVDDDEKP